jgi:hypothetical protein
VGQTECPARATRHYEIAPALVGAGESDAKEYLASRNVFERSNSGNFDIKLLECPSALHNPEIALPSSRRR